MKRYSSIVHVLFLLLMLVPSSVRAQSFDILSVEALVDDHKRVRSVLMARSGVEQANELLHQYSKVANVRYDSLNIELDKYTRAFDIIDVIYNSGVTVLNVKTTYDDVSDRIVKLKDLLQSFSEQCTLKGNIMSSDTIIINACRRTITLVSDEGSELVKSLYDLALYATGVTHITTEGMMLVLGNINDSLDKIRLSIDHAYYVIWKYVTIRTHYWKKSLYCAKNLNEMASDAFSRWKDVAKKVGY